MKRRSFFFLSSFCIGLLLASCSTTVEGRFYVEGACEACKEIIETKLMELPEVVLAEWSYATSQVKVSYDPAETNEDQLQAMLSEMGFQTTFFEANPEARKQLPNCCQESLTRKLEQPNPHSAAHP